MSSALPPADADDAERWSLEAFLLDDELLAELEQLTGGFNLFEILGNVRREERHSDFLAFLLDPTESHSLDETCLRAFVQQALESCPLEPASVTRIDAALYELREARVEREWNDIDIFVTSEADRFVLMIENKIDTDEHSDQLARYLGLVQERFKGWAILPVFLTRDGHASSHDSYHPVSYSSVHRILNRILIRRKEVLPPDIEVALRHYMQMLERHVMEDTPIAILARKIYARHARALDIIFEHRPDIQEHVKQAVVAAVQAESSLRLLHASKSVIQFVPVEWDAIEDLRAGGDGTWVKQKEILRFEVKQQAGLAMYLIVGPGPASLRSGIHEEAGRPVHKGLFANRRTNLAGKWTQVWKATVYSRGDEAEMSADEREARFITVWRNFVDKVLPELTKAYVEHFKTKFLGKKP